MFDFSSSHQSLQSNSPQAWESLIAAANPASLLVAIEHRMSDSLRLHTTPEDILQDVLLLAWRDRARLEWRGMRALRSWLLTIIDHRIADIAAAASAVKRGGNAPRLSLSAAQFIHGNVGPPPAVMITTTPSRVALYREQAEAMLAGLREVDEELREVLRLRLFEHRATDQIARELGIGVAAVRHRLRRGAEAYRRALARLLSLRSFGPA